MYIPIEQISTQFMSRGGYFTTFCHVKLPSEKPVILRWGQNFQGIWLSNYRTYTCVKPPQILTTRGHAISPTIWEGLIALHVSLIAGVFLQMSSMNKSVGLDNSLHLRGWDKVEWGQGNKFKKREWSRANKCFCYQFITEKRIKDKRVYISSFKILLVWLPTL